MSVEIVTKEDLLLFRNELLTEIKNMLSEKQSRPVEWLKPLQLRKLLGISAGTLRTWRITRQLKYSKVGGSYYYRYADVQLMLEKGASRS
ncbi:helix-turn-helix domain-containing protein [Mucilaginibacter sp. UYCu711]|uniref:helix-turn-helix domain-containing protein n=1 Tax=Mucilaginibacter sp. UYCu711 TaxID=3156339 RepID=UPI003D2333A4